MKSFTSFVLLSAAAVSYLPSALAHGYVKQVIIGGKSYPGVNPSSGKTSGVVRRVNHPNPNHITNRSALPCGPGANTRSATGFAAATPGQTISFDWDGGSGHSNWPHQLGPMLNYVARCNVKGCKDDASNLRWYKVSQQGLKPNQGSAQNGGSWFQNDLRSGRPATARIPTLPAGEYIFRHEIIALHEGNNPKMGPEYYPSCVNIRVTDGAGSWPPSGTGVTFPAGYTDKSRVGNAQLTRTIFRNWKTSTYTFPGPPIAKFGGNSRRSRHAGIRRIENSAEEVQEEELVKRSAEDLEAAADAPELVERAEVVDSAESVEVDA